MRVASPTLKLAILLLTASNTTGEPVPLLSSPIFAETAAAIQAPPTRAPLEKVQFFFDSISEKNESYIRLLGGSSWFLSEPSFALVTDDVIVVFRTIQPGTPTRRVAIAYLDGEEIVVRYVTGRYISQAGYLTTVVKAYGHGAILELSDGTLLSVPEYDRYDTGWWLPPYKALLTANRLYLYNLEKVKRVWVTPVR